MRGESVAFDAETYCYWEGVGLGFGDQWEKGRQVPSGVAQTAVKEFAGGFVFTLHESYPVWQDRTLNDEHHVV